MKVLLVGDVHGKTQELEDCKLLGNYLCEIARVEKPDSMFFLGDQYDTHGIVNVQVQKFWMDLFEKLARTMPYRPPPERNILALVGNHDMPGDRTIEAHAMQAHAGAVTVIDSPTVLWGGLAVAVPYTADKEEFLAWSQEYSQVPILICHETFQGVDLGNGFYAKDAVDAGLVAQKIILSGHIHTPGRYGKVVYPGSPRWLTVTDANISRSVWVMDLPDDPKAFDITLATIKEYPTDTVCSKIHRFVDKPEEPCDAALAQVQPKDRIVIDVYGPQSYIMERKKALLGPGVRLRTFPTENKSQAIREADGINVAWKKFVDAYQPKYGTSKEELIRMFEDRIGG